MANYICDGHACPACGKRDTLTALDLRATAWRDPHGFYYAYRCEACQAQYWYTGSKWVRLKPEQEYHEVKE